MKKRLITGTGIVLVVVLAVLSKLLPYDIGNYIFDIFILVVCLIASMEMCNLMENLGHPVLKYISAIYPIFNYLVLLICLNYFQSLYLIFLVEVVMLAVYFLVICLAYAITKKEGDRHSFGSCLNSLYVCVYPALLFCLFLIINHSDAYAGMEYFSMIFIILVFAVTMLTDTFAYLVGSLIKGKKLAPSISPNKTISGAVGGLLGGILGAMLVYLAVYNISSWSILLSMYNLSWWHFALIGLICSVFSQCGDLFESKLKRKAHIKDTSNILPGHGGMLDRIDAMIWCVSMVFLIIMIILF